MGKRRNPPRTLNTATRVRHGASQVERKLGSGYVVSFVRPTQQDLQRCPNILADLPVGKISVLCPQELTPDQFVRRWKRRGLDAATLLTSPKRVGRHIKALVKFRLIPKHDRYMAIEAGLQYLHGLREPHRQKRAELEMLLRKYPPPKGVRKVTDAIQSAYKSGFALPDVKVRLREILVPMGGQPRRRKR